MKNLLAYLYGGSQLESEAEETSAAVERIMEEAEKAEPLKVKRAPLITALKAIGIENLDKQLEYDPEGFSLLCPEESDYAHYTKLLMEPDAMEKLAKLGWVVTRCGDVAMSAEPAEFRIRFLEISGSDNGEDHDSWPAPNNALMTKIIKKGREFATTPMDRDSENELNPVKNPDTAPDKKHAGMGDAADGKDPEGKPKGSTKSEGLRMAESVLADVNEAEKCPHCEGQGYVDDEGNPHSEDTKDERCQVCPRCKGRKVMHSAHAARYRHGVEAKVSKTLGKPWKFEGGHKAGCACGFCRNKGRFGKKKDEPKKEPDSEPKSNGMETGMKMDADPPRYDDMYRIMDGNRPRNHKSPRSSK